MHQFDFSDADWMSYLRSTDIPSLNEWMQGQAKRGQEYYQTRLRKIRFGGERVLDAGCGVGNWSIALAGFFNEVVATEIDAVRLQVLEGMSSKFQGRIRTILAPVEALPFPNRSFDAIFCNGVVFLSDYKQALAEFSRVLKPNAPLYLTYNGKAWWRHLLFERSRAEPDCIVYGANGRISLLFRLLDEMRFEQVAPEGARDQVRSELNRRFGDAGLKAYLLSTDEGQRALVDRVSITAAMQVLSRFSGDLYDLRRASDALLVLEDLCYAHDLPEYRSRIGQDLASRMVARRSSYEHRVHTYSQEPEEMTLELMRLGFHGIQTAHEGCLCLDPGAAHVAPMYDLSLGVFESLALAPVGDPR